MMPDRDAPLIDLGDLAVALGLLTRLPVPAGIRGARAAWAWPVAGLIVATLAGLAGWLALALGLVPGVAAALVLALMALLTGAMHEDGLADSADGLFGGWEPARRLEIMRDSRIGTYGTLAVLYVALARWAALSFLMATGHILAPLLTAAVLSPAALPVVMHAQPPARSDGLAVATGAPPRLTVIFGLLLALAIGLLLTGWAVIPATLAVAGATLLVALTAQARIGGQTGDILGATQQLAELAVLASLCALI
jgi:adenosylcobinamide-GDP ribazoletransferase